MQPHATTYDATRSIDAARHVMLVVESNHLETGYMGEEPGGLATGQETLVHFHEGLRAAVIAGAPLELGKSKAFPFSVGRANLNKLAHLEEAIQRLLVTSGSLSRLLDSPSSLPARYRAALSVYDRTRDMALVLEGLTVRANSRRHLARLLRASFFYLLLVIAVASVGLAFFSRYIVPSIEQMREDLMLYPAASAPLRANGTQWLTVIVAVMELVLCVLLVLLFFGGASKLASWLGGRYYQVHRLSAVAVQTIGALVVRSTPLPEATSLGFELVGSDRETEQKVNLALQDCPQSKSAATHLQTIGDHFSTVSASRLCVLRVVLPITLVVVVGGAVTMIYCLAIFVPLVSLLYDLSQPGI